MVLSALPSASPGGATTNVELVFVLGIDPGLSRCGYGCVESAPGGARPIAVGVLTTPPSSPLPERLAELQRELRALIAELHPDVVAVERVFFQVNVRTAMSVGQASGLAMAEAASAGCEVAQYSPNQVKEAVAGTGSATKDQVERMVQTLLGISQPLRPVDAADAVALALCHLAHAPRLARVAAAKGAGR
ncbi:MAG: crossover junction endodeoxyribonuclease RuvC [Acidimicrobiaceae bacterium]|jgi:crossover junction endodeoxyribonuclease RuvC